MSGMIDVWALAAKAKADAEMSVHVLSFMDCRVVSSERMARAYAHLSDTARDLSAVERLSSELNFAKEG